MLAPLNSELGREGNFCFTHDFDLRVICFPLRLQQHPADAFRSKSRTLFADASEANLTTGVMLLFQHFAFRLNNVFFRLNDEFDVAFVV
jgi:hypothetical protein